MSRLEGLAPGLASMLAGAGPGKRFAAALAIAEGAVARAHVQAEPVAEALRLLKGGAPLPAATRQALAALVEELDAKYFDAQEEDGQAQALLHFGQARAVASLTYAADADDAEAAGEAIYEATATADDAAPILQEAQRWLVG